MERSLSPPLQAAVVSVFGHSGGAATLNTERGGCTALRRGRLAWTGSRCKDRDSQLIVIPEDDADLIHLANPGESLRLATLSLRVDNIPQESSGKVANVYPAP